MLNTSRIVIALAASVAFSVAQVAAAEPDRLQPSHGSGTTPPAKSQAAEPTATEPAPSSSPLWDGLNPRAIDGAARVERRKHSLPASMPAEIH